ncbi:MAG TPA: hypothetical protein VJM08_01310, partial [Anaerolineales bacterium]|nr:hypothetical protein [Anaerolineales bacterium]
EPKLCDLSVKLLLEVMRKLEDGAAIRTPQDHAQATFAPKLTPQEEIIDWKKPAATIHDQIRALSPSPGAWCQIKIGFEVRRLKIKKSVVVEYHVNEPGSFVSFGKEGWIVACGKDALRLIEVQLEGKKAMPAEECIRGIHHPVSMLSVSK